MSAIHATQLSPFARDRLVNAWIVMKSLSDAGDAIWTIALAWTAVQVASPAIAGVVVAAGTLLNEALEHPRSLPSGGGIQLKGRGSSVTDRVTTRGRTHRGYGWP